MLCPVCDIEMLILELHEVEIDWCTQCRGVWLDEGELELLAEPTGKAASPVARALDDTSTHQPGRRPCPVCRKAMARVDLPLTPPVEIDRCPKGHGLWFDNGELQQVRHAAGTGPVGDFLAEVFADQPQS
jgi:Zn-finger nucleic acid-binding protein